MGAAKMAVRSEIRHSEAFSQDVGNGHNRTN